eukprot:scaffold54682_cov68-Phaeocystis_antarctica.AAC.5
MSDLMSEDEKRAHGKAQVEMEHVAGTGLLSEEHQARRMSLVDKPMRELTAAAAAAHRDIATVKDVELDLDLKASAPQKGVKKHVMNSELIHGHGDDHLVAFASLTPEWKLAAALLREMLTQLHPGLVEDSHLDEHIAPEEAYAKVLAACRRSAKKPEMAAGRHEAAGNTEKRRKVQREGRCQSLVLPQSEYEGQLTFSQRLDAVKRLGSMRDGPHVVPVLPQGKAESAAQARMRFEAQACCASAVLPAGPEESGEHFEQRLEALRLTPTRLSPPAAPTPKAGGKAGGLPTEGQPSAAKRVPWPVLPRGAHESDASFDLRLEIAVGCSVPALPQGADESDADCRIRLRAQQRTPHLMLWPYHPQLESPEAFQRRCADAAGGVPTARWARQQLEEPGSMGEADRSSEDGRQSRRPQPSGRKRSPSVVEVISGAISTKLATVKVGSYKPRAPKDLQKVKTGVWVAGPRADALGPDQVPKKACCVVM